MATLPFIPRSSISRICRRQGIHALYITRRPSFVLFPHDLSSPPCSPNLAAHSFPLCLRILVQLELINPIPSMASSFAFIPHTKMTHSNTVSMRSHSVSKTCSGSPGDVPIYLILDALDECPNTNGIRSPRDQVLVLVENLVKLNVQICIFTSQVDPKSTFGLTSSP